MDPYTEQRLREEVWYLHSLWHQGPPSNPNPNQRNPNFRNPNPNQRSNHQFNPNRRNTHQSNFTKLKPVNIKFKKGKRNGKNLLPLSDLEWPINEVTVVQSAPSGWPTPAKTTVVRLPNAQEQAHLDAIRVQQEAIKVSQKFFSGNEDSDGGIDSDVDDDTDDDVDDTMDEDGNSLYNFFVKVFEEDGELREYYKKNNENGEFSCLVCAGIWEKVGKKFKNCVALVQHSVTIAKTKKKKAHRAYAQVICKVLGWDINRLPSMPMPSNQQTNESKANTEVAIDSSADNNKDSALEHVDMKSSDVNHDEELASSIVPEASNVNKVMLCKGNHEVNIENIGISNIDTVLSNVENGVNQVLDVDNCIIPGITDKINCEVMLCESSFKVDDANKCDKNIENVASNSDGNPAGVVNHLCRNVAKMTVNNG